MNFKKLLLLSLTLCASVTGTIKPIEERWTIWNFLPETSSIKFHQLLKFPTYFKFGTATSCFQLNGSFLKDGSKVENSWTREAQRVQPGVGCDHWNHMLEDIELIYQAGFTSYRFSVDWSKIEPIEGQFNQQAIQNYIQIVRACLEKGIEPIVCLFHHVWPTWFLDKGGFEKRENCQYFVRFADYVFDHLKPAGVHSWVSYNEPVGVMLESYFRGKLPPSQKGRLWMVGQVLWNMLNTDVQLSLSFKEKDPQRIWGTVHVMQPLHPYSDAKLEKTICDFFGHLNNEVFLDFYATGHFNWGGMVKGYNKFAPQAIDYIGINYYTHTIIKQNGATEWPPFVPHEAGPRPGEKVSDGKVIYPEGLYEIIKLASKVGKPIYIMENGTSDTTGNYREEYIMKHLYVILKAIQDGYDVRAYYYWSFLDSFNWNSGFKKAYGIYKVDYASANLERSLRKNALSFVNLMRGHNGMEMLSESVATA